jgi:hypothetical protein
MAALDASRNAPVRPRLSEGTAEIVEPRYMWQSNVKARVGQSGKRSFGIFARSTNQQDGLMVESGS